MTSSSSASSSSKIKQWYPLESSPDVLTKLTRHWALPPTYEFVDILSLDPDHLALHHDRKVHACVFLFPDTDAIVAMRAAEGGGSAEGDVPLWIPQVDVGHSCGTFATVHCLAATRLAPGLDEFFEQCASAPPQTRTHLFKTSPLIQTAHDACVTAGQTLLRESDWVDCDHFIAFVEHGGRLWEMDGNNPRVGPFERGVCADVLGDTARVVREIYLPHAQGSLNFSLMALVGRNKEKAEEKGGTE